MDFLDHLQLAAKGTAVSRRQWWGVRGGARSSMYKAVADAKIASSSTHLLSFAISNIQIRHDRQDL